MTRAKRLTRIMQDIKRQLDSENVAAFVILHVPGATETLLTLDPDYSCLKVTGEKVKVSANTERHFKGDKQARDKSLEDTSDMLKRITEVGIESLYPYFDISEKLDKLIQDEKIKS